MSAATRNILFIDARVSDYQSMLGDLPEGTEYFLLDGNQDGIAQMTAMLSSRRGLDSIQLVSHGSAGTLHLGQTVLDTASLGRYANQLQALGASLGDAGDILLYGCSVGGGTQGLQFISELSRLTGADVAASSGLTGSASLGGDWVLETRLGSIEASVLQPSYAGVLGTINGTPGNDYLLAPTSTTTWIFGNDGDDTLLGSSAADGDQLYGGNGNDYLDGKGSGTIVGDYLAGGDGNDVYLIRNGHEDIGESSGYDEARIFANGIHIDYLLKNPSASASGIEKVILQNSSGVLTYYASLYLPQTMIGNIYDNTFIDGSGLGETVDGAAGTDSFVVPDRPFLTGYDSFSYSYGPEGVVTHYHAGWPLPGYEVTLTNVERVELAGTVFTPPTGKIVFSGIAIEDQLLSVSNSLADHGGMGAVSYQWQAFSNGNWLVIGNGSSITFGDGNVGQTIRVIASYVDGAGNPEAVPSATLLVGNVNDAPVAANRALTVTEDALLVFSVADFGFSDVDAGDALQSITITSLETAGSLTLNGVDVSLGQLVSVADIAGGLLAFRPAANANGASYASFGFKVSDGIALSAQACSISVDVQAVRDDLSLSGSNGNDTLAGDLVDVGSFDALDGLAGNDLLSGWAGNDSIAGGEGNDSLDGGAGADWMAGGVGNDVFVVDDAGDCVVELAGQGIDLVKTSLGYSLVDTDGAGSNGANVEKITLLGTQAINATGNALGNVLTGNAAANILKGLAGKDTLLGNAGNDKLYGGGGNDVLTGGAGADKFVFDTVRNASTNLDVITDFSAGTDKIVLDDDFYHPGFAGTASGVALKPEAFCIAGVAQDAGDRIIYDQTTGALYYDADGSGPVAQVQFVLLGISSHPVISATDFLIIA